MKFRFQCLFVNLQFCWASVEPRPLHAVSGCFHGARAPKGPSLVIHPRASPTPQTLLTQDRASLASSHGQFLFFF